jgi:chemotaxis family two-component system response regulator Rcp1
MDGQEALDFLHQRGNPKPHLILLELNLPRKTGHQVLEAVKQDAVLPRIPIIVLTSSAAAKDIGRAL